MSSEQHKVAWDRYVKEILEIRTLFGLAVTVYSSVMNMATGAEIYDRTEAYLNDGGPSNADLARKVFPYAKIVNQILLISRMALLVMSIKWRKFTRAAIFIELTVYMSESLLPQDVG